MATPARLKVYTTSVGFYDAVVAVPSQKAALQAWGTSTNLFAAGRARLVEDPDVQAEALARPGEVIRRSRGDEVAMLGPVPRPPATPPRPAAPRPAAPKPAPPKPAPPDRTEIEAAQRALAAAEADLAAEIARLGRERAELDRQEAETRAAADKRLKILRDRMEAAEATYSRAAGPAASPPRGRSAASPKKATNTTR